MRIFNGKALAIASQNWSNFRPSHMSWESIKKNMNWRSQSELSERRRYNSLTENRCEYRIPEARTPKTSPIPFLVPQRSAAHLGRHWWCGCPWMAVVAYHQEIRLLVCAQFHKKFFEHYKKTSLKKSSMYLRKLFKYEIKFPTDKLDLDFTNVWWLNIPLLKNKILYLKKNV